MKIKKFTQFILENEYYGDINEGDIVPGVTFNSGNQGTGAEKNVMFVHAKPGEETTISFVKDKESRRLSLHFPAKPAELVARDKSEYTAYAYVSETNTGTSTDNEREDYYASAITKIEDFDANASPGQLLKASNSIDLLADFMVRSGISMDATSGANLAKVITTLLLSTTYNTKVTDTFLKFATKIGGQISIKAFLPRMSQAFISSKQSAGMQSFIEEFPKSYAALKPKKA